MISLVLMGAAGRMGHAVEEAAVEAGDFAIKGRVDRAPLLVGKSDPRWSDDLARFVAARDVVIEFSSPEGAREAARVCAARGAALVSGTTGLGDVAEQELRAAAAHVAVLRAANFSLGLVALRRALQTALGVLPAQWDVEIVERHHRRKVDSPSGTALALAREVAARRGLPPGALRFGREGETGPRPGAEIGIHAVRGGSWVGEHAVLLAGEGEWLELRHVAQDRSAFAQGVLAAARFVASAAPGFYTLDDCLAGR